MRVSSLQSNDSTTTSTTKESPKSSDDCKISSLKLHVFHGDTLDGDKYLEDVIRSFQSKAMALYLQDYKHCDRNMRCSEHLISAM